MADNHKSIDTMPILLLQFILLKISMQFLSSVPKHIRNSVPSLAVTINGLTTNLQLDTGAGVTLFSEPTWNMLGKPSLTPPTIHLKNYSGENILLFG